MRKGMAAHRGFELMTLYRGRTSTTRRQAAARHARAELGRRRGRAGRWRSAALRLPDRGRVDAGAPPRPPPGAPPTRAREPARPDAQACRASVAPVDGEEPATAGHRTRCAICSFTCRAATTTSAADDARVSCGEAADRPGQRARSRSSSCASSPVPPSRPATVARLRDETGESEAIWFGRRYIERRLRRARPWRSSGKVELRGWLPRFDNPEFGSRAPSRSHAAASCRSTGSRPASPRPSCARIRHALDEACPTAGVPAGDMPAPRDVDRSSRSRERSRAPTTRPTPTRRAAAPAGLRRAARAPGRHDLAAAAAPARAERADRGRRRRARHASRRRRRTATVGAICRGDRSAEVEVALTDDQRAALDASRPTCRRPADAAPAPGRRGIGQDGGRGAGHGLCRRRRPQARCWRRPTCWRASTRTTLSPLLEPLGHGVTLLTGSLPAAARTRGARTLGAPHADDRTGRQSRAASSSARTRSSRSRSSSPTCAWSSSTSSIGSASPSGRR